MLVDFAVMSVHVRDGGNQTRPEFYHISSTTARHILGLLEYTPDQAQQSHKEDNVNHKCHAAGRRLQYDGQRQAPYF